MTSLLTLEDQLQIELVTRQLKELDIEEAVSTALDHLYLERYLVDTYYHLEPEDAVYFETAEEEALHALECSDWDYVLKLARQTMTSNCNMMVQLQEEGHSFDELSDLM